MKRSTGIILALLLLGFGLCVWNLSAQSIWWDEAFTWQTTSHGLANFWQMLVTGDRNPPLYFVSVAMWGSVAGWSEFSLRFISVAWSMMGLAFLYNLAKRLYNTSAGLWTLALAAVAPALVAYAQEARMYAAFLALTAATLYFAWRVYERSLQHAASSIPKLNWVFLLCEAGLLLAHYFAIPLVVTLNVCAFLILLRRRAQSSSYAKWVGGQILAALPIVIWMLIVFTTPGSLIRAQEAPPTFMRFVSEVVTLWLSGARVVSVNWYMLPWLGWLILPSAVIGAALINRRITAWVVGFATTALATAYIVTLLLTSFHPRYVLPYSLPLFVLLGAAMSNLSIQAPGERAGKRAARGLVGIATAALLIITLVAGTAAASEPFTAKDDARGVAAYLKAQAAPEDVILSEANDYTLSYYDHGSAQTKMLTATNESEAFQQLRYAIGKAQRVWLPHWAISTQDSHGYWPFLLEQSGLLKSQTAFQGYDLAEYELQSPLYEPKLKPISTAGTITQRSDFEGQGADGALTFALAWQPSMKFFEAARTSVRLIDSRGNTLSARDAPLLDEEGRTTDHWTSTGPVTNYYVLPIPPGTPPGTYTVTAQLYDIRDTLVDEVLGTVALPRRLETNDPYRTLNGYNWQIPTNPQIASDLMLDAYAISSQKPGQPMPIDVTLRWRKTGDIPAFTPRLRLAQADRVWTEIGSSLLEHDYPIEQWAAGETVIDRLQINYPPMRGPIELQIGQGEQWTTLTTLQLDESSLMFNPASMQHAQSARFDNFVELLGYDVTSDSLSAARPLNLKLYWRALNAEPITTPYTVFTQVLAPDGHLVAQHDAPPTPPTTHWVPGQIVPDSHLIKVVDPAYRGPATLIVGWYNSASVERVPVQSGGDHVVLQAPVRVETQ